MEQIVCNVCGGSVTRKGNYYVCDYCPHKWIVDLSNDIHAVERVNAWEALRNNDFEKATELFEEIISKDGKDYEAYWGRAFAVNGIVYVNDYNENKKVPTCNNITEDSFLSNKDVEKAISLAPAEIKENYQKQAEYIEKVRIEWLEKASKEPAYDVFISFKDSDREHGVERTQDSIDAQDLHSALQAKGYKVFFSRVSLMGKVAEQYEPYIYNALKTAKVMIVFGEKAEHFNAVWVKNEWSRFKARIEKGEKHKNSLVVVYKNVDPYDIPQSLLGGRQAIDYSVPSNYEVLMNHVKKVIEASQQVEKIERIEIKGGQISKKSSTIKTETIKTREIGKGAKAETDIDTEQKLKLVYTYIKSNLWDDAKNFLDEVLFDNPTNAKAQLLTLFIKYRVPTGSKLELNALLDKNLNAFNHDDVTKVEHVISTADKGLAESVLVAVYENYKIRIESEPYVFLLKKILPYSFDGREKYIENLFEKAIVGQDLEMFKVLLTTLNSTDVDKYIEYNLNFAKKTTYNKFKLYCINNVLSVQEGNVEVLKLKFALENESCTDDPIKTLEEILKYSTDIKKEVLDAIKVIISQVNFTKLHSELLTTVLKYYPEDLSQIEITLEDIADKMLSKGFFADAERICALILGFNKSNAIVYLQLCMCKLKATSRNTILNSDIPIRSIPEFTKYLTLVDEQEGLELLGISKSQDLAIEKRKRDKKESEKRKIQEIGSKAKSIIFFCLGLMLYVGLIIGFIASLSTSRYLSVGGTICLILIVVCHIVFTIVTYFKGINIASAIVDWGNEIIDNCCSCAQESDNLNCCSWYPKLVSLPLVIFLHFVTAPISVILTIFKKS